MRFLRPQIEAAMKSSDPKRLLLFFEADFPTGWVRCHTGVGDRIYQGNVYQGIGEFYKIGPVSENASTSANRLSLTLLIKDKALLAEALRNDPNGRPASLHLVLLDEHRRVVAGQVLFEGEMADLQIEKGSPSFISLTVSDWFERWSTPPENARWTNAAQQSLHPGDQFFDQVERLASKPLPSHVPGTNIGGGGGGGGSRGDRYQQMAN